MLLCMPGEPTRTAGSSRYRNTTSYQLRWPATSQYLNYLHCAAQKWLIASQGWSDTQLSSSTIQLAHWGVSLKARWTFAIINTDIEFAKRPNNVTYHDAVGLELDLSRHLPSIIVNGVFFCAHFTPVLEWAVKCFLVVFPHRYIAQRMLNCCVIAIEI